MDENVSVKVLETFIEVENYNQKINDKIYTSLNHI